MLERADLTPKQLLAMPIAAEPGLQPLEKETSLNLLGSERAFTVYSRHPTCIRGLLRQPEFVPELAVIVRQGGRETLVGVKGRLPVACLHIGSARKQHFLSQVFARRFRGTQASDCVRGAHSQGAERHRLPLACPDGEPPERADRSPADCVRRPQ